MRYIKRFFEELSPDVYKNAGNKLKEMGQIKRGNNLINYSNSFKDKFKLNLFTKGKSDEYSDPITVKEYEGYYHHFTIEYGETGDVLNDALDSKFNNFSDNYITIKLYFYINGNIIELGQFVVMIYNNVDDIHNEDFKFTLYYETPFDKYTISDELNSFGGLCADRRSAYLLKKKLVSILLDDINISDIISISGGLSSHYESFINNVNNINTNLLISDISKDYINLF